MLADFDKLGYEVRKDGIFVKSSNRRPKDLDTIFKLKDFTESEFVEEASRRIDAMQKEAAMNYRAEQSFENKYHWQTVTCPELANLPKVGASDLKIFSRIRFAIDKINNTMILCVNTHGCEYKAVPLTSSKTTDIAKLSVVLSNTDAVGTKYANYYDELTAVSTLPFKAAITKYRNHEIHGIEEFVEYISEHYPCSMLTSAYLKLMLETKSVKIMDDAGQVQQKNILVPSHAVVAQGDSTLSYSAVKHIVEQASLLSANPQFIIDMPRTITNDPNVAAFKYINLDELPRPGEAPAWDELCSRYTPDEAKVLLAYIWSMFVADNRSRQLLYIYDPLGFSAKSVLQNAIASAIGDEQVGALQKDSLSNQFGLAKIWNKRVVFIGDNKNRQLIRSEKMHMALGGDMAEIEYKQASSFLARLNLKIVASGNVPLNIDPAATHERSRLIVLKPKVTDEILKKIALTDENGNVVKDEFGQVQMLGDPNFEKDLIAQFPQMLTRAKKCYEELCPTNGNIILPPSVAMNIEECKDDLVSEIEEIFASRFEEDPEAYMKPTDLRDEFKIATENKDITFEMFVDHLTKRYGVHKGYSRKADKELGIRNAVYIGLRPKPQD